MTATQNPQKGPKKRALPPEQQRTRIVPVRMHEGEYRDALACASALGISLARLMRSRAEALPPLRSHVDLETAHQLGKIGSNLNQLTRLAHSGFQPNMLPVLEELRPLILDLVCRLREVAP